MTLPMVSLQGNVRCLNPVGGVFPIMAHTGRSEAPPEGGTFFSFLSKVVYERVRSCTSGQDLPYKNFWQICKFNISCPSDKKLYTHGVKIGSLPLVANPEEFDPCFCISGLVISLVLVCYRPTAHTLACSLSHNSLSLPFQTLAT